MNIYSKNSPIDFDRGVCGILLNNYRVLSNFQEITLRRRFRSQPYLFRSV